MGNKWNSDSEEDSDDLLPKEDEITETDDSFGEDEDEIPEEVSGMIEKDEY